MPNKKQEEVMPAASLSVIEKIAKPDVGLSEIDPNPDHQRIEDPFEAPIRDFGISRSEIEGYIRNHLVEAMKEMGLDLRGLAVRGGEGAHGRILDAVFEYDDFGRGIYEDEVLRYLDKFHPMGIEGVRVSFRPLNDKQTGSMEDFRKNYSERYMEAVKKQWGEVAAQGQAKALKSDDIPEPPPMREEDPNDVRARDYQAKIDIDILQDYPKDGPDGRTRAGGVQFSRDEISQIAAALGTTMDLRQGGWILPDGRILRFIQDGVRRKEQDIGIGFTEERKQRIARELKSRRQGQDPSEHKQEGTGPYDINGYVSSQPVDPYGALAPKSFPNTFPLEAVKGGLIRYALSRDGDGVEIDVYNMPTQGQIDVLEDIHDWIKFVNEGGYDRHKTEPAGTVQSNEEITTYEQQQPPAAQPAAQDAADMVDEDGFEQSQRDRHESAYRDDEATNKRFLGQNPDTPAEDIPKSRLILIYVGTDDGEWWDYDTPEEVQANLIKDLRTYFRDGKKPNEDFRLPEEFEKNNTPSNEDNVATQDESVGWLKGRNADIFPKRVYRPRSTLLKQVDYDTARRIIRENVSLIKTIPFLDILEAEKKMLAYLRLKITRDQLARYFYRAGDGAITRAWSEVIADDQINKACERLLIAKWKKNGVTAVRWVHSNFDEPRPYHREKWNGKSGIFDGRPNGLNGYVFFIDYPPVIDPRTGERGYPGQMINCKCHLEPVD